jgi:dinuclear metal center YbgI/SA1388 family protein
MLIHEIIASLEEMAPPSYAAEWDNVGLIAGSRQWQAESLLLTIDLTDAVLREAIDLGAKLIVSYHPPIFRPIKALNDSVPMHRVLLESIAAGVAIYSPHTALDAAPGGINDWLAEGLGPGDSRALHIFESLPESEQTKVITFCPHDAVDVIRNGLAAAGAGKIGKYQLCSYEISGRGTFFAGEGTNPTVGVRGSLQYVDEVRLEMVCPKAALALAIATLRQFHPYEEPAFEIYPMHSRPMRNIGQGRRLVLDQPATIKTIVERIKQHLNLRTVEVAPGRDAGSRFTRIGLCAGAGGSMAQDAIDQNCEVFFTGEMRHHDILSAQAQGCTVILAGHANTERGYLRPLKKRLAEQLVGLTVHVSKRDVNPLRPM